jgi:hypothetical protein
MKMTVKRKYLLELRSILANANQIFGGTIPSKVRYAFSVNMKRCNEEAREIEEGFPNDEKWMEYERGRIDILHEAGINSNDDLNKLTTEQMGSLEERIKVYAEPYEDAIKAQEEINKARMETLDEDVEVELRTITPDELPPIILETDDWQVWNVLFNDGNGIVRE